MMSQSHQAPAHGYQSPLSDQQDHISIQEQEPRKRRRVAVACKGCRTRKTRCNGNRPRCSTCAELNLECVYQ
ncbi:hypothetical protein DL98DRAFT_182853 [Cadophora sp. DSE1049]|nr:hypothetical protein DL98DRAFT_182853 [Cadophora sp. DSE1049]